MDKQIIIDGVDVSGCGYIDHDCAWCDLFMTNCAKETKPCYYKQLKRKEQECSFNTLKIIALQEALEQYETDLSTKDCIVETCKAQYKELEAENDKYALFIEKLCDYAGLECDSEEQAMRTLSDLASQMNKARWIIDRYKQTLTEIKEIAEILAPMTDEYDNCYYKDRCSKCEVKEDCQYFKVEQILQKISECEVEDAEY